MEIKRITAAVLSASILLGVAACNKTEKEREKITEVMDSYVDAVEDVNADGLLELTNWDDDDDEYVYIEDMFGYLSNRTASGRFESYIASSISVEYKSEDISIKESKASVTVNYKLVDWESVYYGDCESFDEVLEELKTSKKVMKVKGKISFELEDGEWKITSISKLDEVYAFVYEYPIFRTPEPVYTDPTETEPTQTDDPYVYNDDECESYLYHLGYHEEEIRRAEEIYGKNFTGIYDMNADGVYELYYISVDDVDDDYSSGTLHIFEYNDFSGEPFEVITIPEIVYMAEGGSFVITVNYGAIVITCYHGEEAHRQIDTYIYGFGFDLQRTYRRDVYSDYDHDTDEDTYEYEYFQLIDGEYVEIDEDVYMASVKLLVENAIVVIGYDYLPAAGEVEYPLNDLPDLNFISYDDAYEWMDSVVNG